MCKIDREEIQLLRAQIATQTLTECELRDSLIEAHSFLNAVSCILYGDENLRTDERTLIDDLTHALQVADASHHAIWVWKFADAPPEYKSLSTNGGDEDWVAFVSECLEGEYIGWMEGNSFDSGEKYQEYSVPGGVVRIGSHG